MLDPRRLLTFREVARRRSFSRAAEALALSQPAVSHQVAALERELGVALLTRGRAGATPTPAGELLLAHAEAIAARLALADTQLGAVAGDERRTLRLGAFPSALATIVPTAIAALRAGAPTLEVAVEEGRVEALAQAVRSGRLHAAVCFQDARAERRDHDGLRRVDLADEPMLAVLPASHRLAGRAAIALRELAGEAWMAPAADGLLVDACRAAGFEPRVVVLTRDPLAARALAAAGIAVSLTPRLMAGLPLPGIVTPALREPAPRRALYAVLPEAGAHPLASALADALATAARASGGGPGRRGESPSHRPRGVTMPASSPGPSVKDPDQYEALRRQGESKEKAARIANTGRTSAGRKGGKAGSYDDWPVDDLRKRAAEIGIEGRSKMSKGELMKALRDH